LDAPAFLSEIITFSIAIKKPTEVGSFYHLNKLKTVKLVAKSN